MSQKQTPNQKTLGRPTGSLNAPIAAFTMAVILCSYCFISIRSARRDAQGQTPATSAPHQRGSQIEKNDSWIQQALEERRSEKGSKGH